MNYKCYRFFLLTAFVCLYGCYGKGSSTNDSDAGTDTFIASTGLDDSSAPDLSTESDVSTDSASESVVGTDVDTDTFVGHSSDSEDTTYFDTTTSEWPDTESAMPPDVNFDNLDVTGNCGFWAAEPYALGLSWDVSLENCVGEKAVLQSVKLSVQLADNTLLQQTIEVSPEEMELSDGAGTQRFTKTGTDVVWDDVCSHFCPGVFYVCDDNDENCRLVETDGPTGTFTLAITFNVNGLSHDVSEIWQSEVNCFY